jgi:hypothetical protein
MLVASGWCIDFGEAADGGYSLVDTAGGGWCVDFGGRGRRIFEGKIPRTMDIRREDTAVDDVDFGDQGLEVEVI